MKKVEQVFNLFIAGATDLQTPFLILTSPIPQTEQVTNLFHFPANRLTNISPHSIIKRSD